jgi:hypothetical protein
MYSPTSSERAEPVPRSIDRLEGAHAELLCEIEERFGVRIEAERAWFLRTPEALTEELARRGALEGARSAPARSASAAAARAALARALGRMPAEEELGGTIARIFREAPSAWERFCEELQVAPRRALPRLLRHALVGLPFAPLLATALLRLADPFQRPLPAFAPALTAGVGAALVCLWLGTRPWLRRALPRFRLSRIEGELWLGAIEAQVASGRFSADEARAWICAVWELLLEDE